MLTARYVMTRYFMTDHPAKSRLEKFIFGHWMATFLLES
jgi:hypothetical protein